MDTPDSQRVVPVEATYAVTRDQLVALVAGPYMYHHKMDEAAIREGDAFTRCRDMTIERIDVLIATRNAIIAAPATSPPVAPIAAAQEGVKPIPACWRYVHADPSNSSGWMDYDGDAELWELRGKKAQANGLTIELAYSRPPAQTQGESRYTGVLDDPKMQELFSSTIMGALAFGAQNTNPPPDGHWLTQFWNIGRTSQPNPPASPEDRRDGERLDWLSTRLDSVDWSASDGTRLSFQWPVNAVVCADVRKTIDNAIDATQADHEGV